MSFDKAYYDVIFLPFRKTVGWQLVSLCRMALSTDHEKGGWWFGGQGKDAASPSQGNTPLTLEWLLQQQPSTPGRSKAEIDADLAEERKW